MRRFWLLRACLPRWISLFRSSRPAQTSAGNRGKGAPSLLVFEGDRDGRSHSLGIARDRLPAAPQEQADGHGGEGYAGEVHNKARLIETGAIVPMSDRDGTGRTTDGIRCPAQSV